MNQSLKWSFIQSDNWNRNLPSECWHSVPIPRCSWSTAPKRNSERQKAWSWRFPRTKCDFAEPVWTPWSKYSFACSKFIGKCTPIRWAKASSSFAPICPNWAACLNNLYALKHPLYTSYRISRIHEFLRWVLSIKRHIDQLIRLIKVSIRLFHLRC